MKKEKGEVKATLEKHGTYSTFYYGWKEKYRLVSDEDFSFFTQTF